MTSQSDLVRNLIALYKALGSGWQGDAARVDPTTLDTMRQRTDWGDLLDEESLPQDDGLWRGADW